MENKKQNEKIELCICCNEPCTDKGNDILECDNCDENYGTYECSCRQKNYESGESEESEESEESIDLDAMVTQGRKPDSYYKNEVIKT